MTCGEYLAFIEDGGYRGPEFWLSDGWDCVNQRGWEAPLYWEQRRRAGRSFTLAGLRPLDPAAPVCHVSFYEADAFARWAGKRLPTRGGMGARASAGAATCDGRSSCTADDGRCDVGDVWEWTASPYVAYPGYRAPPARSANTTASSCPTRWCCAAAACATPAGHVRPTYRNFFPPDARWQFGGIRLAEDLR